MVVSDHIYHGRHLRPAFNTNLSTNLEGSDILMDTRISDIVISSSNLGQLKDDRKWVLMSSNSSIHRYSQSANSLYPWNNEMLKKSEHLDLVKDDIGKHVSHVVKEAQNEILLKVQNDIINIRDTVSEEVMSHTKALEDKIDRIRDRVSEEVMARTKPLEDKIDRISRLLERVLVGA